MSVTVPSDPKVYTSTYENFKGVDFTNDPSNVYRRRSPGGKNMLPDLDGKPYKRKGWTIETPYTDFLTAAGSQETSFTPARTHHFSLGGEDYMIFFNSLGVFYKSESTAVTLCQLASGDVASPTLTAFPPQIEGNDIAPDYGRAFFFESNGTAGFYVYVGTELFRFDGNYFWAVEPYVPRVLVACDKYGTGTMLDPINLMTRKRTVQYLCDGETVTFIIPCGCMNNEAVVEFMTENGTWEAVPSNDATYGWSISQAQITFATAPPVVVEGEDNMRLTYTPDGSYVVVTEQEQTHTETEVSTQTVTQSALAYASATAVVKRTRTKTCPFTMTASPSYADTSTAKHVTARYTLDRSGAWSDYTVKQVSVYPAVFSLSESPSTVPTASNVTSLTGATSLTGNLVGNAYSTEFTYTPANSVFQNAASGDKTESETTSEVVGAILSGSGKGKTLPAYSTAVQKTAESTGVAKTYTGTVTLTEASVLTVKLNLKLDYSQYYTYSSSTTKTYTVITENFDYVEGDGEYINHDATAFTGCQRAFVYGSGLYNQVFYSSTSVAGYGSRVWYSAAGDPTYVPDTNYIEAGGNDTQITGMMKVSGYVGIIKQGSAMDASVYLAYPTSFDTTATFAVTQAINGVGALAYGAFNILNEEPLFLSKDGVMGIEVSEEEVDRRVRSRSYFINKKLCAEEYLDKAFSFVHKRMYYLSVPGSNHCYVLDGTQKSSWANEKTNLQYECYYLENIPAQCFSTMDGTLYFVDNFGNLCRFKDDTDANPYRDDYSVGEPDFTADAEPVGGVYDADDLTGEGTVNMGSTIRYGEGADAVWYTVTDIATGVSTTVTVTEGVAIDAVWDTIADDDNATHFFKNLRKKGCVVSLLPGGYSGVTVSLKADEKSPVLFGTVDASGNILPYDYFVRKKIKKYKRLQIICENDGIDESFGIDQIIKSYTMGNYSKNRKV